MALRRGQLAVFSGETSDKGGARGSTSNLCARRIRCSDVESGRGMCVTQFNFNRSGGREMTASLPRRKQPRVTIAAQESTDLPDEEQQALIQGGLLRECDEALARLMKFSRQQTPVPALRGRKRRDQRCDADDVRYIEHMINQIVATVPENDDEMIGKAAVYREYADFSERRPEVMAIMLRAASEEMERERLRRAKYSIRKP